MDQVFNSRSEGFVGFENLDRQMAVVVLELPTPPNGDALTELERVMTADNFRKQGVELESTERIRLDSGVGLLLTGRQSKDGVAFRKYVLFLPINGKIAQILISMPMDGDRDLRAIVGTMIRSFRAERKKADTKIPPYVMSLPKGWFLAKQAAIADIYNRDGRFPAPPDEAYLVVLNLHEPVAGGRQPQFVRTKNLQRSYYSDLQEIASTDLTIDDCPANVSFVSAIDEKTKQPIILQYCYIFLPRTTFLLESRRNLEMPDKQFEEIAKSWKLRR